MHFARTRHTALRVADGRVLVISPTFDGIGTFPFTDIYDYHTQTWTLSTGQGLAQMAGQLADGTVLTRSFMNEVIDQWYGYQPSTDIWSSQNVVIPGRNSVAAGAMLLNNKFLVSGGLLIENGPLATCELYDPNQKRWVATGSMNKARMQHTLTLLSSGMALAAGGSDGVRSINGAEIYDPQSEAWTIVQAMPQTRDSAASVLLPNGNVLVAGGESGGLTPNHALATAVIYNPN
jgi:hypothetical protein